MRIDLTSPDPLQAPVTLAEVKEHARIDHNASDSSLSSMIDAMTVNIEQRLRVPMVQRTYVQTVYDMTIGHVELERAPVQSIDSVEDGGTTLTEGEDADWTRSGDTIFLSSLPNDELTITFTAGLAATVAEVPAGMKEAIKRYVSTAYDNPSNAAVDVSVTKIPAVIRDVLLPYARFRA